MYFETERLVIRDFQTGDLSDLHEILGDGETMKYCEPAYDIGKTEKFLREFCIGKNCAFAAALKDSGKVIGYLLFKPYGEPDIYELGWIFNRCFWRLGYAYEAVSALIKYGFSQMSIHKFFAETIDPAKSVGLMRKLGMKPEGVQRKQVKDMNGNWADLYLYGLLKEDFDTL